MIFKNNIRTFPLLGAGFSRFQKSGKSLVHCLAIFSASTMYAQSSTGSNINIQLTAADKSTLDVATAFLLNAKDSSFVKAAMPDPGGAIEFVKVPAGTYLIAVNLVGYQKQYSAPFAVDGTQPDLQLPPLTLQESATSLAEVTVSAQKPFIERKIDRLIVNVENSILSTGSSAMDVLERSPGVIVGANESISIRGRSGVIVMIDGKPNPMSGQDLANYLKALPSNSIERIEIITNPPAKYDAAGNAGIIDIRLKKDKNLGLNGSFSTNYGQGVYPKTGFGLNLNHRSKKMNAYGSYNYSYREWLNDLRLYRSFFANGARTGAYDQRNYLVLPFRYQMLRAGVDYYLNKKTTLGLLASGSMNRFNPNGNNASDVENAVSEKISAFRTANRSRDQWPTYSLNANVKHDFNGKGRELTFDADYARYWNETVQNFTTRYYNLEGVENRPLYLLTGDLNGNLQIRSLKFDYTHPVFGGKGKLEAGAKSSLVDADNDLVFFDKSDAANPKYDSSISNHFLYRENINAAYVNFNREWGKFSLQTGLRVENTVAKGEQLVTGQTFDRNYTNLFPTAFFTYKFSDKYEMGLNLSRRLDRPTYRQLNPFKFFLDPTTYNEGNPYLNPQFTWSAEWNHTLAQRYNFTLAYARTFDNITQVIGPVEGVERVTVQTDRNLAQVEYLSFAFSAPIPIAKWWNSTQNFNTWIGRYRGNFANTNLQDGNLVAHWTMNNAFTLKKDWSAELNFTYKTDEIYGFMHLDPMWGLGFGVQKQILQKRGTIKLAATDVFWTNLPSAVITYRDYTETFEVFRETRQVTLSYTHRFGKNSVKEARRRAGGAEEEKRRAGNG